MDSGKEDSNPHLEWERMLSYEEAVHFLGHVCKIEEKELAVRDMNLVRHITICYSVHTPYQVCYRERPLRLRHTLTSNCFLPDPVPTESRTDGATLLHDRRSKARRNSGQRRHVLRSTCAYSCAHNVPFLYYPSECRTCFNYVIST